MCDIDRFSGRLALLTAAAATVGPNLEPIEPPEPPEED